MKVWPVFLIAILAAGSSPQIVRSQPAAPPALRPLSGRVVVEDTGVPLRNVTITVVGPDGARISASDGEGRFAFGIDPRSLTASFRKAGYTQRTVPLPRGDAPWTVPLPPGAVLSGRVTDRFGEPLENVPITAERVGSATPRVVGPIVAESILTDDRGEFRVGGLERGEFRLVATAFSNQPDVTSAGNGIRSTPFVSRIYFPGVANQAEAEVFKLAPGEERARLDFVFETGQLARPFLPVPPMSVPVTAAGATGVVRGRVVDTAGRPIANTDVGLLASMPRARPELTRTDADGRFSFANLVPGSFRVIARRDGYGQGVILEGTGAAAMPFELKAGERRERFEFRLPRLSVVSGRVVDEFGDPMPGMAVELFTLRTDAGRRALVGVAGPRLTDDLGIYRIGSVAPGQYVVSASGSQAGRETPGYPRTYFPGTAEPALARYVTVGAASEVTGIDVPLTRVPTVRVAGRVLDEAGDPTTGGSLTLLTTYASAIAVSLGARRTPDGRFEFLDVPSGQYVIQATRGRKNGWTEGEFAALPVSVGSADVTGLTVRTSFGVAVSGRVVFDAPASVVRPARGGLTITTVPIDLDLAPRSSLASADIDDRWNFQIGGLQGPRRFSVTGVPDGWALREIRAAGIPVTDRAIEFGRADRTLSDVEIVLTDRVNRVSGQVIDGAMRPARARVAMFPIDRALWYRGSRFLSIASSGDTGRFTAEGAPDGAYYVAAFTEVPPGGAEGWSEPSFLDALIARATTLTHVNGQTLSVSLSLARR